MDGLETKIEIPQFTRDEYLNTTAPFEFLYSFASSPFVLAQLKQKMAASAREVGVPRFLTMFAAYVKSMSENPVDDGMNITDFDGQKMEYVCGSWKANDNGIFGVDRFGMPIMACYHPIIPTERLVNVDTKSHKVRLEYKLGGRWFEIIEDKSVISDSRAIIGLSKYGIHVTSDNSRALVKYLSDVEQLNYNLIPETASVGRLGWIDGYGFSPYDGNLVFDGDEEYRSRFEAVKSYGDLEKSFNTLANIRENDTDGGKIARIVLAASFASVLVSPMKCLPFFVHLWGGTETGKTVALMAAASVWADPEIGRYIQTFNATEVGKELGAAFCNSLPMIIDELQLVKDNRKDFDKMIYQLSEGVGRARGRKSGGLQKTPTWKNCIISTGEYPILSENSGGGAVNRTIEINCTERKLFDNGKSVVSDLFESYGHIGKYFVKYLEQDGGIDHAREVFDDFLLKLKSSDRMDKQTASVALILTADTLVEEWIFKGCTKTLSVDDVAQFLKTKNEVDQNARALEFIADFVVMNISKFSGDGGKHVDGQEIWGRVDGNLVCIIKSKFASIMQDEGYNSSAFLSWARVNGVLNRSKDGRNTISKYVGGKNAQCVCLKIDQLCEVNSEDFELL